MANFQNRYDTSASRKNSFSVGNDYRRKYIQVANLTSFNPAYSENLQAKLTNSEIIGILNKKSKTLNAWTPRSATRKITVTAHQLKTNLYQFFDKDGVKVIPFEIVFYGTEKKIEDKIAAEYPDMMSWELQLNSTEALKRYYKMKEDILSGLTERDYEDVLQFFFESGWFLPNRKFVPWVWYDVRQVGIKPFPYGPDQNQPGLILKGNIFFWGDLWFERYLRDSVVTLNKGFGSREFIISPNKVPSLFCTYSDGAGFRDWMLTRLERFFSDGDNIISNLFLEWLGLKSWKGIKISVERTGLKDIKLTFNGIYQNLAEKIWNNKGKILLGAILGAKALNSKRDRAIRKSSTRR